MGISDGLGSGGEVDCSVGTIVWVRRRNGSWWPGKILGPNELSASHLMSPRSGTPVKLLGREDASVDWYNLEKSKRVKAFRCGEFDDCIERAESSQGIPIKKREKYARREDAILHALELEREQLEKKQQKLGIAKCASNKMAMLLKKDLATTSENLGNEHCKFVNLKSQSLSKGLDSSLEEESMDNTLHGQKAKHGKQLSLEDDNSEAAIPRMRGLQDFGLRIASKRKLSGLVVSEGSRKPFSVDNHVLPSGAQSMGSGNHVRNGKNSLSIKRKRTQSGLIEESLVKKRDRRRPLVQVLQSSAKLSASQSLLSDGDGVSLSMQGGKEQTGGVYRGKRSRCVYLPASSDCLDDTEYPSEQQQITPSQFGTDSCHLQPGSLVEEHTSGLMEEVESDSSLSDFLDPDMNGETAVISDSDPTLRVAGSRNSQGQQGSMSSEDLDESAVTGYMSHFHPHDQTADADLGVSKWQLKGKRNIRNLLKRPVELDGKSTNGSIHGTYLEGKANSLNRRALRQGFYHGSVALNYDYDEAQKLGFGNRRYPSMLKANSKDRGRRNADIVDSEEDSVWEANELHRGYWDESGKCFDPMYGGHFLGNGKEPMLVDVDLQVQASYQGEHVPLVSLMSRLNGKAIIGHPIQIEALEDGSTDLLHSTTDYFSDEPIDNDGNAALTPVWRTGRRTAMHRVPRPHPSTALDGDVAADPPQNSDPECKPPYKAQPVRKSFTNTHRPPTERKCPKKPTRKVSLSSQKTRTLSSIATEQKLGSKAGYPKLANKSSLGGLIKPEIGLPTVTCIPVKLAFSRLLEAVGRPPSRTSSHSVPIHGDTERKPS